MPCLVTDRNVPLRLALRAAGFRADPTTLAGRAAPGPAPADIAPVDASPGSSSPGNAAPTVFSRSLSGPDAAPLPELPPWAQLGAPE